MAVYTCGHEHPSRRAALICRAETEAWVKRAELVEPEPDGAAALLQALAGRAEAQRRGRG